MILNSKVSIHVFSPNLIPDEIGNEIGLDADRKIFKGTPRGKSPILKHQEHVWIIDSKANEKSPIDDHIVNLRNRLGKYGAKIYELKSSCTIQCVCIVICDSAPPLNFPNDLINWLSEIGASLDVDLYIESEPPSQNQ